MDLVDRDEVLLIIKNAKNNSKSNETLDDITTAIKQLSTQKFFKSHWVVIPLQQSNILECANCGYETTVSYRNFGEEIKICPHCCAMMTGNPEISQGIRM